MNFEIFETYDAMCRLVADEIVADLKKNPNQMLCIAAGHTSLGVFNHLIEDYKNGKADFSQAYFAAMDEWLHMSAETKDSCGAFLVEHFLRHVNYPQANVRLWNGLAEDCKKECLDVEVFIKEKSVHGHMDYLLLGSGMNGHLALNEPGTSFSSTAHTTALDPVTQTVGQKYFRDGAALSGGITLGIENFRQSGRTVLMIDSERKSDILYDILSAENPDENLPASALLTFENAVLYCDRPAAKKWLKGGYFFSSLAQGLIILLPFIRGVI